MKLIIYLFYISSIFNSCGNNPTVKPEDMGFTEIARILQSYRNCFLYLDGDIPIVFVKTLTK